MVICCGSVVIAITGAEINSYLRENDDDFAKSAFTRGRYLLKIYFYIDILHHKIIFLIIIINSRIWDNGIITFNAGTEILIVQGIFDKILDNFLL